MSTLSTNQRKKQKRAFRNRTSNSSTCPELNSSVSVSSSKIEPTFAPLQTIISPPLPATQTLHLVFPPQPPQGLVTVTMQTSVVQVVPKEVYDVALQKNANLRAELLILREGEKNLQQTICNGELTIEELQRENMELKAQIDTLRAQIQSLRQIVDTGALKNAISSYFVAILDILKHDKIDLSRPGFKSIAQRLSPIRTSGCHYLVTDEDPNIIIYKKYILREKIGSIKTEVRSRFELLYPGLLNEVKLHLDTYPPAVVTVDESTKAQVDFWWT